mgnify:CR=1 FL=1
MCAPISTLIAGYLFSRLTSLFNSGMLSVRSSHLSKSKKMFFSAKVSPLVIAALIEVMRRFCRTVPIVPEGMDLDAATAARALENGYFNLIRRDLCFLAISYHPS